jgi:hypothetical protein
VLTVDRTEWHFGQAAVNVLVVGVVFGEVAVPIAWTALATAGGSGADDQTGLLEAMLHVVDPASVEALVADREFISTAWLRRLQAEGIPFAIRLRSDRRVAPSPDASALPARLFARVAPTGRERVLRRVRLNTGRPENDAPENDAPKSGARRPLQPVDLVMKRVGPSQAEDPFVILAVWKAEPSCAMDLYRQRWSIETLFAALKSRGFDLEQTHVTAPSRIERLIGLLALALVWARLVGEQRTQREGPPRRKSHGRRQRSRFRYGLDRLQRILTTPRPQPKAFFECLRLLRSPTSVLSCT